MTAKAAGLGCVGSRRKRTSVARPRKDPNEKRDQRFNLRFTAAELAHVETQARIAGLSPHEFLRRRSLGYTVPQAGKARTDPAVVTELNRLGLELKAIGVNANARRQLLLCKQRQLHLCMTVRSVSGRVAE